MIKARIVNFVQVSDLSPRHHPWQCHRSSTGESYEEKHTFSVLGAQQEDGGGRIYAGRPRHISSSIDLKVHKREAFNTLQVFASYIGLALHHAKLYDKIKKNEQKYKVVQEVVNYQSTAPQHEVQEVKPPKRL